jgi:hypothetical protein
MDYLIILILKILETKIKCTDFSAIAEKCGRFICGICNIWI